MATHQISCFVNGVKADIEIESSHLLIDVLRDKLGLISVKRSCDMQVCGACTVLIDGKPVSSCTTLAVEMDGADILTAEGLSAGGNLHPIQQAFIDKGALQCGFCTYGMMLSSLALLKESPNPSEQEIQHYLHGNICRCTGYTSIIKAVQQAAVSGGNGE
ncbi:(2Fe-2S)-binding protein [Peribacillus sp. SCS-155]|uniref:(2Fe-2S)-binding protein n=1 Tax=Peribacillus sedimenti TaxID=3115297 RepID=UPI003906646E